MIRHIAALAAFALPVTAGAQSTTQEELEARHDRALAAGYKSLFLCSALSSDPSGLRTSESKVERWELTGIYPKLDPIVRTLPHRVVRAADGFIDTVETEWADDMPPRIAQYRGDTGCALAPIGMTVKPRTVPYAQRIDRVGDPNVYPLRKDIVRRTQNAAVRAVGETYGEGTRTTAVLVRQADTTRAAVFAPGFDQNSVQRTWSVAKSIAATLVGAAVGAGAAEEGGSAGLGVDETDPRRAITLNDTLRMASGRYSDTPGNRTDPLYMGGASVAETALHWPLVHPPGTVFRYANNDTVAAVKAIDEYLTENPPIALFERLGMHSTKAETDWQGDYILSSQVWTSAADLARLGQLYLDNGVRNGTRVLPEYWVEYVSTPSGPQPGGARGWGYGAGWWLFNNHEGIPSDTFFAAGNRGQYVVVVPSRDVVIVRRGEDPAGTRFDIEAFTRDVLATLADYTFR